MIPILQAAPLIKLLHLLFLFVWIGSLLAFTWLLGAISKEENSVQQKFLKILRRMYFFLDLPAMIFALSSGIVLFVIKKIDMAHGWLHMKFTFAFFLILCDLYVGKKLSQSVLKGKKRFHVLRLMATGSLAALLLSVYVIKNKVTSESSESSLAKKEGKAIIFPLNE